MKHMIFAAERMGSMWSGSGWVTDKRDGSIDGGVEYGKGHADDHQRDDRAEPLKGELDEAQRHDCAAAYPDIHSVAFREEERKM